MKGHGNHRSGTRWSDDTREKIVSALTGREISLEQKVKLSKALKGTKHTDEHNAKISEGLKGRRLSKESRLKMSGENHYNWKGGTRTLQVQIRQSFEYKIWRTSVFERDNYTCQSCNVRGGRLNADHYPIVFSTLFKDNKIASFDEAIK